MSHIVKAVQFVVKLRLAQLFCILIVKTKRDACLYRKDFEYEGRRGRST